MKDLKELDKKIEDRKDDHIKLSLKSQASILKDDRFYYEPILSGNNTDKVLKPFIFLGKTLRTPIWVSSMTGGTKAAKNINLNLARACNEFGMGMGLGSCRSILKDSTNIEDFQIRKVIGKDLPLYANLGIAQIEELLFKKDLNLINILIKNLDADGLVIHINPLQEFLQPEGDIIHQPPIETIKEIINKIDYPLIVKEVGQGMGPDSLKELLLLPISAIELASYGGTNFSNVEIQRNKSKFIKEYLPLSYVGHSASEMLIYINDLVDILGSRRKCKEIIISGGIKNFLDGYYFLKNSKLPAIYGQASTLLQYAQGNYEDLNSFLKAQILGLSMANQFLRVK